MSESANGVGGLGSCKVVVTGYGCVTALGCDVETTWRGLVGGLSARGPLRGIPVEGCRVTEGAEVDVAALRACGFHVEETSRASVLLQRAVGEALSMAGFLDALGRSTLKRVQLCVSTTACAMEMGEQFLRSVWSSVRRGRAEMVARYQAQQQVGELHAKYGFGGPVMTVANACASGANAVGHAYDLIRSGMAEVVFAGGYDALCELVFAGFDGLQSLAPVACRPFDRGRNGLMLGEGAGFLVLESQQHAAKRGASVRGYVEGYGHATDLGHLTQPNQDGKPLMDAMAMALRVAGLPPRAIDYINAHGTGTPMNDLAEARAIEGIFAGTDVRVSSTKAALGHTLGAAGAIEAVLCLRAMETGVLPPQINVIDPEGLVAERLVAEGEKRVVRRALSLNLGFGGSAAALVLGAPDLLAAN